MFANVFLLQIKNRSQSHQTNLCRGTAGDPMMAKSSSKCWSMLGCLLLLQLIAVASAHETIEVIYDNINDNAEPRNPIDPDANYNFTQIVTTKGYPCETYNVTTSDGYILTIFRIPYGRSGWTNATRTPVMLQHGLMDSSFTWILNEANQSLPYLLADTGLYDVWMTNSRGNQYAKTSAINSSYSDTKQFWAFSWDQMAEYDIPATVSFILNVTGFPKLTYVGHSEGTTIMFAKLSQDPSFSQYLTGFAGFGPVITVGNMTQKFLREMAKLDVIEIWVLLFGDKQFLPTPTYLHNTFVLACADCEDCCNGVIEFLCGRHMGAFNNSRMPVMAGHEPGGSSVQNMQHWTQMINHGLFQMMDYGPIQNQQEYGSKNAPLYNISNLPKNIPYALYSGSHDVLADPIDVAALVAQMPNGTYHREIYKYAHLDYIWAIDAKDHIYDQLMEFIKEWVDKAL